MNWKQWLTEKELVFEYKSSTRHILIEPGRWKVKLVVWSLSGLALWSIREALTR